MRSHVSGSVLDLDVDIGLQGDVDSLCLSWGTPQTGECSAGVRALMLAVLEEAIHCFLSNDRRAREEAERWIVNDRWRSPFSFVVVCETLGLDPGSARRALHRLRRENVSRKALGRSRPNVRRGGRLPGRKSA
jgi:hypothetical protein